MLFHPVQVLEYNLEVDLKFGVNKMRQKTEISKVKFQKADTR